MPFGSNWKRFSWVGTIIDTWHHQLVTRTLSIRSIWLGDLRFRILFICSCSKLIRIRRGNISFFSSLFGERHWSGRRRERISNSITKWMLWSTYYHNCYSPGFPIPFQPGLPFLSFYLAANFDFPFSFLTDFSDRCCGQPNFIVVRELIRGFSRPNSELVRSWVISFRRTNARERFSKWPVNPLHLDRWRRLSSRINRNISSFPKGAE